VGADTDFAGDTWDLASSGTAPLVIESLETSCPECLSADIAQTNLFPNAHTQLTAGYRPIKDRDAIPGHQHLITIRSNAINCPIMTVVVIIDYRDGYAPPSDTLNGYELYDDFTNAGTFDEKWNPNDEEGLCSFGAGSQRLSFNCTNASERDNGAAIHPDLPFGQISGVAGWAQIDLAGGEFKLAMLWVCSGEGGEQREYHLRLDIDKVTVQEFYPLNDWSSRELGTLTVSQGWSHLLQIEQVPEGIAFYVDRQRLSLSSSPDLPACATPEYGGFGFWVWQGNNSIIGHLEEVYVRR
jgi:hypothetical protein